MMQATLQKIDRRIKPIRKESSIISESLKKKKIFLEQENFDILQLLQQNQTQQQLKEKEKDNKGRKRDKKEESEANFKN